MAYIETIRDEDAQGRLQQIFAQSQARAGRVYNILRLQSQQPAVLEASIGLYLHTTTSPRAPLPRWFRELIAVHTSRLNDCFY